MAQGTRIALVVTVLLVGATMLYWLLTAGNNPAPASTPPAALPSAGGSLDGARTPATDSASRQPAGSSPGVNTPTSGGGRSGATPTTPLPGGASSPVRSATGERSLAPNTPAGPRPLVPAITSPTAGERPLSQGGPVAPGAPLDGGAGGASSGRPGAAGAAATPPTTPGERLVPEVGGKDDGPPPAPPVKVSEPVTPPTSTPRPAQSPNQSPNQNPNQNPPVRPAPPAATPAAPSGSGPSGAPAFTEYAVRDGDTMVTIAEEWFDDRNKWDLIAKANPGVDPTRLRIGQTLRLPAKSAVAGAGAAPSAPRTPPQTPPASPALGAGERLHEVKTGDTLFSIARSYYGTVEHWKRIYEANRAQIGSDPAALKVGTKLKVPAKPAG